MSLPNPGMVFVPFDILTAQEMNDLAENIESLAAGSGMDDDSIAAAKLNFGGSGSGIWWEEIGRTVLGTAGDTISVTTLPARKYLMILFSCLQSGVITPWIRFNNDSGTNYNYRYFLNQATAAGAVNATGYPLDPASAADDVFGTLTLVNRSSYEKLIQASLTGRGGAGGGNQAATFSIMGKWANTSAQINRVDVYNNTGAGDFAVGSEVVVLGHD